MACERIKMPGGGSAIICGPRARARTCSVCKRKTENFRLCDFRLSHPSQVTHVRTCDAVLCTSCAVHREPDYDYCPLHAAAVEGRLKL